MFKVIATDVVISKGYDGAPALKFSENGESVRFRIGKKVYDTRAENNTRWVNLSVKAFGPVCERIKKMQLIGYITSVTRDDTDSVLTVDFGDGRIAEYDGSDLEMLDLAYASTIHKSQGSEYKSVIINLQCAHAVMLVRPLVYTAITRAKERVLIVGERRALCIAIKRTDTEQRGTMLSARIKELISNVKGDHYNGNLAQ